MRIDKSFIALVAAVCGCATAPAAECSEPTGSWQVAYHESEGDCGPMTGELLAFGDAEPTQAPGGDAEPSRCDSSEAGSFCSLDGYTLSSDCQLDDQEHGTVQVSQLWTFRRSPDGLTGAMSMTIEDSSGQYLCRSTYDIDSSKI